MSETYDGTITKYREARRRERLCAQAVALLDLFEQRLTASLENQRILRASSGSADTRDSAVEPSVV